MMKRISLMASPVAGLSIALSACGWAEPPVRPNVIFILVDDMGYGDLGCYGQQHFPTPNIDRLAAEGMRFTAHYAGAPVSGPSRCCLMTGQHTGHGTIRANHSGIDGGRISLSQADYTLGNLARDAGYRTAVYGKWGLAEPGTDGIPTKLGFDDFLGYLNNDHALYYYTDSLYHNEGVYRIEANQNGQRGEYTHDIFTREALSFIGAKRSEPFFLYLAYTIPHMQYDVPKEESDPFLGRFVRDGQTDYDSIRATFVGMVTRMDRDVGRIMRQLEASGMADNTVIFFASDNGPTVNRRGGDYFLSGGGSRGFKGQVYEGGIRVPLIVRWKDRIAPGSTTGHVSAFWDLMPTLAGIMGVAPPRNTDGVSYLPTLLGRGDQPEHEYLYWEFSTAKGVMQAVRMGDHKVLTTGREGSSPEVYDLSSDPYESNDLSGSRPDIVTRAERYMKAAHTDNPNYPLRLPEKKNKQK